MHSSIYYIIFFRHSFKIWGTRLDNVQVNCAFESLTKTNADVDRKWRKKTEDSSAEPTECAVSADDGLQTWIVENRLLLLVFNEKKTLMWDREEYKKKRF
jgi:hypothetical protein